jgi:hypothetical protein
MGRLTVRLPGTLHKQLTALAEREGVSLNQFIVYALTRQATLAYTVHPMTEDSIAEQRASYNALLQNLGQASFDEIRAMLKEREHADPETTLNPDVVEALRNRLANTQH